MNKKTYTHPTKATVSTSDLETAKRLLAEGYREVRKPVDVKQGEVKA